MSSSLPPPPPGAPPPAVEASAPPPSGPEWPPLPWEQRSVLGIGPAIVATAELLALRPREGFVRARRTGDLLSPLLWTALMALVAALFQLFWSLLIGVPLQGLIDDADGRLARVILTTGGGVAQVIFGPITAVAGAFIAAGILHGGLALLGGLERTQLGYEGSLRAVAYAYTAQLGLVVPVIGGLISFFWMLALVAIGLEVLHDTTSGRALAAVLIPVLACCLCGVLLVVLFGAAIAGMAGALG